MWHSSAQLFIICLVFLLQQIFYLLWAHPPYNIPTYFNKIVSFCSCKASRNFCPWPPTKSSGKPPVLRHFILFLAFILQLQAIFEHHKVSMVLSIISYWSQQTWELYCWVPEAFSSPCPVPHQISKYLRQSIDLEEII